MPTGRLGSAAADIFRTRWSDYSRGYQASAVLYVKKGAPFRLRNQPFPRIFQKSLRKRPSALRILSDGLSCLDRCAPQKDRCRSSHEAIFDCDAALVASLAARASRQAGKAATHLGMKRSGLRPDQKRAYGQIRSGLTAAPRLAGSSSLQSGSGSWRGQIKSAANASRDPLWHILKEGLR
jgi:hypothetical protein